MKRRIISIMLALVFCLTLATVTALAADTTTYGVMVGGTPVTSENMGDVLGDGTVKYEPAGDGSAARLTLREARITGGISSEEPLEISAVR